MPWWLVAGELIPIIGIIGGVVSFALLMIPLVKWMNFRHELAKEELRNRLNKPVDQEPAKVQRLEDRLVNLENLICRLDAEMNQQLEKSLSQGRIASGPSEAGVSQMPTAFMSVVSALEGRYQVLKELGRGGMGIVFQAHDKQLKEQVALKIISPMLSHDPEALERLKREVSSARRISHPNVIRIFDFGDSNGLHFVSMEYFNGMNLKEYIRKHGALSLMQSAQIVMQIADGLQAAHREGIVHRDLKTQNVIISPSGHIKIIDFGLARTSYMEGMTATGLIMGTPEYMAPEQIAGKKVDERADIYSLGIILYEVFTGRVPFTGDSAIAVGFKQMKDPPDDPCSINPQLPKSVAGVILKALEKDPIHRYRNVADLRRDLEDALQGSGARGYELGKSATPSDYVVEKK